jgi:hypothetical protein
MLALRYVSLAALAVLAGVGFGWRIPVAVALATAALGLRLRVDTRWPKSLYPNKLFVALDLLASGIVGGVIGGLIFGDAVTFLGFAFGVASSLASIPLSTKNVEGKRVPLTLQSSPSTAKALNLLGLLSPLVLLGVCVLILVSR